MCMAQVVKLQLSYACLRGKLFELIRKLVRVQGVSVGIAKNQIVIP